MPLTPRERVLATINHEVPDRVPIVMGVSNATGIKMKPYRELKQLIGVEAEDNYIYQWPELGTAEIDEETMKRLRVDVYVLKGFGHNLTEAFQHSGWIIHLSFVGAAGDVTPEFLL